MAVNFTKGDELMIFINNKPIALVTGQSLDLSADEIDVTSKDSAGNKVSIPGQCSWEMQSEQWYTYNGLGNNAYGFNDFYKFYQSGEEVDVKFTNASNFDNKGLSYFGGTPNIWNAGTSYWQGKARIYDMSVTFNSNDMSTFSATLRGNGALSYFS